MNIGTNLILIILVLAVGVLLALFALFIFLVVKDLDSKDFIMLASGNPILNAIGMMSLLNGKQPPAKLRQCPHCAEMIKAEAKVCRFCQRDVPPITTP